MSKKIDFQLRVLNKYGVLPVFEGDVPSTLPNQVDGETFAQWSQRVLGVRHTDVSLYMPVTPKGNTHIRNIGVDSQAIKRIAQKAYRNGRKNIRGINIDKVNNNKEDLQKIFEISEINADLIYKVMAGAVNNRSPETDEFFKSFAHVHKDEDEWKPIFESLVRCYVSQVAAPEEKGNIIRF